MPSALVRVSSTALNSPQYVVAVLDNLVTNYSDLAIFDARRIAEGPFAFARLPFRLRPALHGNWADAARLRDPRHLQGP